MIAPLSSQNNENCLSLKVIDSCALGIISMKEHDKTECEKLLYEAELRGVKKIIYAVSDSGTQDELLSQGWIPEYLIPSETVIMSHWINGGIAEVDSSSERRIINPVIRMLEEQIKNLEQGKYDSLPKSIEKNKDCWDSLEVRLSRTGDGLGLTEVHKQGFPGYPHKVVYEPDWHEEMTGNDSLLRAVALLDGRIVGGAGLGVDSGIGEVKQVVVLPDCRCKNISYQLIKYLEEEALKRGCYKLVADVRERSPGMQRTFINLGWSVYGVLKGAYIVENADGVVRESMIQATKILKNNYRGLDVSKKVKQGLISHMKNVLREYNQAVL